MMTKKTKIIVYINSLEPSGGVERIVAKLVNEWCDRYEICILVKDFGKVFYEIDPRISIKMIRRPFNLDMKSRTKRILSTIKTIIFSYFDLKKFFRKYNDFDFIYVASPLNAFEISLLGKSYIKKLIISEHASAYAFNRIYNYFRNIIYPKAYMISVPTKKDTELYLDKGFNAVYIPHLSIYENAQKNELTENIVLNVGRLTEDKQHLILLKIWKNVYKRIDDKTWKLQIVGGGEEKERIKKTIKKENLGNCVELIEPTSEIDKIYSKASIFAFTSKMEGFGLVLLEAMSFGIPCISFDCPSGPKDLIIDEYNGNLIECFDMAQYENKLIELIQNKEKRIFFGNKAFEKVKNWNNKCILEMWDKIFTMKE